MFGLIPSAASLSALKKFEEDNIKEIIELGAGLGRYPVKVTNEPLLDPEMKRLKI